MKETKYSSLFSPIKIGNRIFKNRILAAPMGTPRGELLSSTNYGGISLYDKALGGSGGVVVAAMYLGKIAGVKEPFEKYARDVSRETLSVLKATGSLAIPEFVFDCAPDKEGVLLAPSDGISFLGGKAKAMTKQDMKEISEEFVRYCREAKDFGFDSIMLEFGHDSLCSVFLSPVWNQRTDEYGGSVENRTRFARETLIAVRKAVGPDYPIMIRISRTLGPKEYVPETYEEDDMMYFIQSIEKYVDLVIVANGMDCYGGTIDKYESNVHSATLPFEPRFSNLEFSKRIKKECPNIKVCLLSGVNNPAYCNQLIEEGKIDMVMLGRQLVADPFWPQKALEGRDEDIVPCLRCNHCYHIATVHGNVQCSVNPRFRRENRVPLKLEKTDNPKKVVVIGGGPAGMKAALTADEKGHHVILLEKEEVLGGQLVCADYDHYKEDLRKYRDYLKAQVKKSHIDVRLGVEATPDMVKELEPDGIIVAVGADFITPNIPGVEYARQAVSIYPEIDEIEGEFVVIGGGTIGSEIALELAERGKKATVIEMGDTLAAKGNWLYRLALRQHMNAQQKAGTLDWALESKVVEIKEKSVIYEDKEGNRHEIKADHILLAAGMRSRLKLANSFFGITPNTALVGDCEKVSKVVEATNYAYFIGSNI